MNSIIGDLYEYERISHKEKKIVDILNSITNYNNCKILLSLRDPNLFEILVFLHIFKIIRRRFSHLNIFVGLPSKFEFIKTLYHIDKLYILRVDNLEVYRKKFHYIFDIPKRSITPGIASGNIIKKISLSIFGDLGYDIEPVNLQVKSRNEYSDIVGINFISQYPNIRSSINIHDQTLILNDIRESGLRDKIYNFNINLKLIEDEKIEIKLDNKISPLKTKLSVKNYGNTNYSDFVNLFCDISSCRYFVSIESDLALLASMILGQDKCVILSKDLFLIKSFPFFENIINISDCYISGHILNIFENIADKEFSSL